MLDSPVCLSHDFSRAESTGLCPIGGSVVLDTSVSCDHGTKEVGFVIPVPSARHLRPLRDERSVPCRLTCVPLDCTPHVSSHLASP